MTCFNAAHSVSLDTAMAIRHAADLGEHNETVLREVAGLSPERIGALAAEGVISDRPRPDEKAP